MNEFDALLARAVEQARALGIPVSARISPRVAVNRRAVTRFGCCIRRGGEYVIELSERLLEAEERACMQTLAHEVLHTCPGCRNHGALWKEYAARMNGAYGYAISRTGTCEALGVADVRPVRYRLVCERCGQEFCRSRRSPLVDHRAPRELAEKIRKELGVVTPGLNTPVSRLSGGNVQKVLVGRELAASPIVLMTAYAVRGLDINTSYTIYNLLNEQKEKGVAVIYVGEDLDVLLELCDRILVLCGGKANGMLDARTTTKEEVGLRMTNLVQKEGK